MLTANMLTNKSERQIKRQSHMTAECELPSGSGDLPDSPRTYCPWQPPTNLGQAGGEQHTLKQLAHPLQKLVHIGPFQDVHLKMTPHSFRTSTGIRSSLPTPCHLHLLVHSYVHSLAAGGHFLKQVIKSRPSQQGTSLSWIT